MAAPDGPREILAGQPVIAPAPGLTRSEARSVVLKPVANPGTGRRLDRAFCGPDRALPRAEPAA
jgi:hypothetical protein